MAGGISRRMTRRELVYMAGLTGAAGANALSLLRSAPTAAQEATPGPAVAATPTTGEVAPQLLGPLPDQLAGKTGPPQVGGTLVAPLAPDGGEMRYTHLSPIVLNPLGMIHQSRGAWLVAQTWDGTGLDYDLAESHREIEKDRVFEFKLRTNAKWHDGQPVTAEDVFYTFYVWSHKAMATLFNFWTEIPGTVELKQNGGGPEILTGVQVVDDHTVRIELDKPHFDWVFMKLANAFNWNLLPAHVLKPVAPEEWEQTLTAMPPVVPSCGAWKFKDHVQGQYTEFERFDDYHHGRPHLDGIIFRAAAPETLDAALEIGDIHFGWASNPVTFERFGEEDNLLTVPIRQGYASGILPNPTRYGQWWIPLQQAIMHGIDIQTMTQSVMGGLAMQSDYPWETIPWLLPAPEGLKIYRYDPTLAEQALTEAGWDFDRELKYVGTAAPLPWETFAMQQLNSIGLKVIWEQIDPAQSDQVIREDKAWDLQTVGAGIYHSVMVVIEAWHSERTFESGRGQNATGFSDPQLDALFEKMEQVSDREAMKPIIHDVARRWSEVLPSAGFLRFVSPWVYNRQINAPAPPASGWAVNSSRFEMNKIWLS